MGLKTYFEESKSKSEGFNHELCDVFDIFQKHGHECVMLSVNDKYPIHEAGELDYIFVFNGPTPTQESGRKLNMFKRYSFPIIDMINTTEIPYAFFWTDSRYGITNNKLFKRQPNVIFSQEKEYYGHLEKLILYKKERKELTDKKNKFGILMNETEPKRSKEVLAALEWLEYGEIVGKWKTKSPFVNGPILESELDNYLSNLKFSYNLATNQKWVSQKYYEMILNNVICFYKNYDEDELILNKDNYLKVRDGIDIEQKIEEIEANDELYKKMIEKQQEELKDDYFNGEFIYNFIINKIKI